MGIHSYWLPRKICGHDALLAGANVAIQEKNATSMKAFCREFIELNGGCFDGECFAQAVQLLDALSLLGKSQYKRVVDLASDLGETVINLPEQRRQIFRLLALNMTRANDVADYDMAQYSGAFASNFALPDQKAEVISFYKPLELALGSVLYRWSATKGFDYNDFNANDVLACAAIYKRAFGEAAHAINLAAFVAQKTPVFRRRLEGLCHNWLLSRECAQTDFKELKASLGFAPTKVCEGEKEIVSFPSFPSKRPQSPTARHTRARAISVLASYTR